MTRNFKRGGGIALLICVLALSVPVPSVADEAINAVAETSPAETVVVTDSAATTEAATTEASDEALTNEDESAETTEAATTAVETAEEVDTQAETEVPVLKAQAHVSGKGWLNATDIADVNGQDIIIGTTGQSRRLEALRLWFEGAYAGSGITVKAHVASYGWLDAATLSNADAYAGTIGKSKSIEALCLTLSGELANQYDIYYQLHCANYGWLGWAKNGEKAGTRGYGKRAEAIRIRLVKKGDTTNQPAQDTEAYKAKPTDLSVQAHVQTYGWLGAVGNNAQAGTTGQSKRMEALNASVINTDYSGALQLSAYTGGAWQNWQTGTCGTTGRSQGIHAIKAQLTGELAQKYDIYYQVHCAGFGWLGWTKNGEAAGSIGYNRSVQAIKFCLVEKGSNSAPQESEAFKQAAVSYSAHVQTYGWQYNYTEDSNSTITIGTTGQSKRLEAFTLSYKGIATNELTYAAYVSGTGQQAEVTQGQMAGTTGASRRIESVHFNLSGSAAQTYDIWYRVHVSSVGWLGWASNGAEAGTQTISAPIEAIQVVLLAKGSGSPGDTTIPFYGRETITFSTYVDSKGWTGDSQAGGTSGTTGQGLSLKGFKATFSDAKVGGIRYKVHVAGKGWLSEVSDGDLAGSSDFANGVQAISISLTGNAAKYYDVYYQVHVGTFGWLGWAKNGQVAGTTNCSINAQAITIKLVRKGGAAPGGNGKAASYSSKNDLPYIGYQNPWYYYQVSNRNVSVKGSGKFGFATASRISYNASRNTLLDTMIGRALEYVGTTPYIWDYSCDVGVGVDCAGLVMQSLYAVGMDLGWYNPWDHYYTPGHDHYANAMWNDSRFCHVSFNDRQRGDLVCYPGHIAIYIGGDKIIEAYPRAGVRISSVYSSSGIKGCLRPIV